MAEDKANDKRFRAVLTYRKVSAHTPVARRDEFRGHRHVASNLPYWEDRWARDDATIGMTYQVIVGHYDDLRAVKAGITRQKGRVCTGEVLESVVLQKAPLVWENCDDKGSAL